MITLEWIVADMTTTPASLPVRGSFSLAACARLGFGRRGIPTWEGVMPLAFVVDDYRTTAGVEVRQPEPDTLQVRMTTDADPDVVLGQVARILSVDVDGRGFDDLARRDEVVGRIHRAAAGLRPAQFHSPYEAAVWSILSTRRSAASANTIRERLGAAYGSAFTLGGRTLQAVPTPDALLRVTDLPGLPAVALPRLHAAARAALDGQLSPQRLRSMDPEAARADLQSIAGIGPFYSGLIVYRSLGLPDVLPLIEPRSRAALERAYGIAKPLGDEEFIALARRWRPYRMWMVFLARATA